MTIGKAVTSDDFENLTLHELQRVIGFAPARTVVNLKTNVSMRVPMVGLNVAEFGQNFMLRMKGDEEDEFNFMWGLADKKVICRIEDETGVQEAVLVRFEKRNLPFKDNPTAMNVQAVPFPTILTLEFQCIARVSNV